MMKRIANSACAMKPKAASRSQCQEAGLRAEWTLMPAPGQSGPARAQPHPRESSRLLAHLVPQHSLAHPPHGQAVGQAAEGPVHRAVLRNAELPGAVVHRHLHDAITLQPDERWQEAMHTGEELHFL